MKVQILVDGSEVPYRDGRISLEQQVLSLWIEKYGEAPLLEDKDVILHRIGAILGEFWDFGQGYPTPRSFDRSANRSKCFNYIRQYMAALTPENPVRDFLDQCFGLSEDPKAGVPTGRLWELFQSWCRYTHSSRGASLGYKGFNAQLRLIATQDPQSRFVFREASRAGGRLQARWVSRNR